MKNTKINWANARRATSKVFCLLMIAAAILTFSSCSSDDKEKSPENYYTFKGTKAEVILAEFEYVGEGPGYSFELSIEGVESPSENNFWIDIPEELMGTTISLTAPRPSFPNWGVWFEFNEGVYKDMYWEGNGAEGSQAGTCKVVKNSETNFTIDFDFILRDGSTLKGHYSGEFDDLEAI